MRPKALRARARFVVVALALVLPLPRVGSAQTGELAQLSPKQAEERSRDRMRAGVRLYQAQDYRGALVEFEAAYKLSPRASPLINIALCQRALSRYPRAIAALETALSEHAGTLDPQDRAAATRAIEEMRALIGVVEVRGLPVDATLRIGDDEWSEGFDAIALSPGSYTVTATAPGHVSRSAEIVVLSGERVSLDLVLAQAVGTLRVLAADKNTPILVDGKRVGRGSYQASLPTGPHSVELLGETEPVSIELRNNETSSFESPLRALESAALPPVPEPPAASSARPPRLPKRGPYGLLSGAVLFPLRHPDYFGRVDRDGVSSGGSGALRAGYLVHDHAGFELLGEYNNVIGPANGTGPESYSLTSWRVGPLVRLQTRGDSLRLVGSLGGGFSLDLIDLDVDSGSIASRGVDFFALVELGGELDLDGVLLGLSVATYFAGTKGMNDFDGAFQSRERDIQEPYGNRVLVSLGPRLSVGYAFW